jgi:hypothetical protein
MFPASVTGPSRVASFRGLITALAVLALFAGLASAQVANSGASAGPFQCIAGVAVPPVERSEGLTELVGDIVLTCSGGSTPVVGSPITTANFTVSFATNATSRLLGYNTTANPLTDANTSEALLLIDEPGSGLPVAPPGATGFGPEAPQTLCGSGGVPYSLVGAGPGGCIEYVRQAAQGDFVMSSSPASPVPAANVFAGVVNGNQVTFYGIPILPPAVSDTIRVFRITNIRVDTNAIAVSGGTGLVFASISISSSTSVPLNQPLQVTGFTQSGLIFNVRTPNNSALLTAPDFSGCSVNVPCPYGMLRFSENFGTAFKTRTAPVSAAVGSGQARNLTSQNIPGAIYNSESGFVFSGITGTSNNAVAGLTDFGTRLKAVFSNVVPGVRIFVATTNIANLAAPPAGNSTTSFAQLVTGETVVDSDGSAPSVSPAGSIAWNGTPARYGYSELSVVNGSATAVWEVVNTNPATLENFDLPLWIQYPSGVTPAAFNIGGNAAPNGDNGAFSIPDGASAQNGTYPMPRFTSGVSVAETIAVSPNHAPNTGNVTVVMNSNAWFPFDQVTLSSTGLPDIPGTFLSYPYLPAAVNFNLAGAAPGPRDVLFSYGGYPSASFPGAFTVLAPPPCTYHLGASSAQYGVGVGSGQVVVSASSPSCTWSALSDSPWLVVSPITSPAILNYSVQANPGPGTRTGTITVGGSGGPVLTVTQAGTTTCTFGINPTSKAFPADSGSGSISITAPGGCAWSVTNIPGWVNVVSGSSGSGNGSFNYTVPLNSGGPRTAALTVMDKTFSLSQGGSACGAATDITSQVSVARGAFLGAAPLFQAFSQTVTLKNTGTTTIAGPIQYILDGLPRTGAPCPANATCTVTTPAPTTTHCQSTAGSAMVQMSAGSLAPGQSVSKTMTFAPGAANGGSAAALQYTPRVLSGIPN